MVGFLQQGMTMIAKQQMKGPIFVLVLSNKLGYDSIMLKIISKYFL